MKCSDEDREERLKAQKEAQEKMERRRSIEKANRLKELEAEKEAAMLKAASKKK